MPCPECCTEPDCKSCQEMIDNNEFLFCKDCNPDFYLTLGNKQFLIIPDRVTVQ